MLTRDTSWEEGLLQMIVGQQLSSVEFVQDYVQLNFDGPTLKAIPQPAVEVGGREFRWDEPGFRDELCRRIARKAMSARIFPGETIRLMFDDSAVVEVSLRQEDYRAAEAIRFDLEPSKWWVL